MKTEVLGLEKLEATVGNCSYVGFSLLKSMTFFAEDLEEVPAYSLLLVMETEREDLNFRMQMKFTHVRELRLSGFGGSSNQITGFDVTDISERQLEGISFQVADFEGDVIRFFSKTAEVQAVERIEH